jgi:hypothetical protein
MSVHKSRHFGNNTADSIRQYAEEIAMRDNPAEIEAANDALWNVCLDAALQKCSGPPARRDGGTISIETAMKLASGEWRMLP